jgi:hypothetical protein
MASRTRFAPVPLGPVAYARKLRRVGWLMALLVPAVLLGLTALAKVTLTCPTGQVCNNRVATNWVLPGMALPTAILWGIPLRGGTTRYIGVVASSAALWAILGVWAAGRATRRPIATWRTWFREYSVLLIGVWLGVLAGLFALGAIVGQNTFSS